MIGTTNFLGMYLPWLMPLAVITLFLTWIVRRVFAAFGLYRWIWHPALFDMAFYVLMLYGVSSVTHLLSISAVSPS